MSVVIHSPQTVSLYRRDSATSVTPLVPSLDPAGYGYTSPQLPNGNDVKAALDELFRLSAPKAEPGWQLFESSGSFVVPSGVTEVLLLSIGAGGLGQEISISDSMSATWGGSGGYAVSSYFDVTPGSKINVTIGATTSAGSATNKFNNVTISQLSPNLILLKQAGRGAGGYKNPNGTAVGSLICRGGGAGGGFMISSTDDERKAWLDVALDNCEDGSPTSGTAATATSYGQGGVCWPDTTRVSTSGNSNTGGSVIGYGGGSGGGPNKNGSGKPGTPGKGVMMIFWGPDIRQTT